MTKKQSLYYIGAVVTITILGFLYTTLDKPAEISEVVAEVATTTITEIAPEPETVSAAGENDLLNTSWRWLRTENATGTVITQPLRSKPFILSFADGDSMGSQTDCNSIAGSYVHEGAALSFGPPVSTKMFCEESQEVEYMNQLNQVTGHAILNNMLLLSMNENAGIMYFVKVTE